VPSRGNRAAREIVEQAQQEHIKAATRRLDALAARVPEELRGETSVLQGLPADVIVEAAKKGYGMVVLATNGRTGLSHTLLGSVAERVVRLAPVPVLVVR
jgi:nucleotide-binding universal stress UspA family protein